MRNRLNNVIITNVLCLIMLFLVGCNNLPPTIDLSDKFDEYPYLKKGYIPGGVYKTVRTLKAGYRYKRDYVVLDTSHSGNYGVNEKVDKFDLPKGSLIRIRKVRLIDSKSWARGVKPIAYLLTSKYKGKSVSITGMSGINFDTPELLYMPDPKLLVRVK